MSARASSEVREDAILIFLMPARAGRRRTLAEAGAKMEVGANDEEVKTNRG